MKQGGSWLAQRIAEGDVFVPEEFSEEQQMIRDSVIEFCVKEIQEPSRSEDVNSLLQRPSRNYCTLGKGWRIWFLWCIDC